MTDEHESRDLVAIIPDSTFAMVERNGMFGEMMMAAAHGQTALREFVERHDLRGVEFRPLR